MISSVTRFLCACSSEVEVETTTSVNTAYGVGDADTGPCLTSVSEFDLALIGVVTDTKVKKKPNIQ